MNNSILLRRKNALEVNVTENILDLNVEGNVELQEERNAAIASICKNFNVYGYNLSKDIIDKLKNTEYTEIVDWYLTNKNMIEELVGFRPNQTPLYINFPNEIMSNTQGDMYLTSLVYFLTKVNLSAKELIERPELNEFVKLTTIELADKSIYYEIFTNLLKSKVSLNKNDFADLEYFIKNEEIPLDLIPEKIPNKENLVSLTKMLMDNYGFDNFNYECLYKTATDVLRLAVSLSDGDISLSSKSKFKKFSKAESRFLLKLLNNCKYPLEDMWRYRTEWIRLGEIIHPGSYAKRYPNAFSNFDKLRNEKKIPSFAGKVENAFNTKDLSALLKLLSSRPGEFATRLDRCLVEFPNDNEKILSELSKVLNKVETTVIIRLMEHMKDRKINMTERLFFPKGSISKMYIKENNLGFIDTIYIDKTIELCESTLKEIFSTKDSLGKVYIDEEMKKYIFPMVLRTASRTLKPMARGSKISLKENCKVARMFLYWQDAETEVTDLDLSEIYLNEDFGYLNDCYYGNYNYKEVLSLGGYHSGDVREAPNGASEYIDLNLETLKENNIAYAIISVHSFTKNPFSDLRDCYVGVMERENPLSGEIFEPSTIVNKSDLISNQLTSLSCVLDVYNKEIIWLDLGLNLSDTEEVANNIKKDTSQVISSIKNFKNRNFINIYDLVQLNVASRGELVDNKADADYIISLEGYIEPEVEEVEVVETVQDTETEITEEPETEVIIPKRELITPYNLDKLIAMFL